MQVYRTGVFPDRLIEANTARIESQTATEALPPAPASALALPIDTARSQVNQAAMMPGLMAPTADGIFTIGSVALKVGNASATSAKTVVSNSWGFT